VCIKAHVRVYQIKRETQSKAAQPSQAKPSQAKPSPAQPSAAQFGAARHDTAQRSHTHASARCALFWFAFVRVTHLLDGSFLHGFWWTQREQQLLQSAAAVSGA
jgi:hypothetical protein